MTEPEAFIPDDDSDAAQAYRLERYGVRMRAELPSGGVIRGAGSAADDSVLVRVSGGHYYGSMDMSKHRHLLDLINAGRKIPGFASGGLIQQAD